MDGTLKTPDSDDQVRLFLHQQTTLMKQRCNYMVLRSCMYSSSLREKNKCKIQKLSHDVQVVVTLYE